MASDAGGGLDPRLTLALERSWKAIEDQRDRLGRFHDRATGVLGAASIVVAVGAALNSSAALDLKSGWSRFALASFALAVVLAVFILLPRSWRFESDPGSFQWYFENATIEQLRSSLLADAQRDYRENGAKLKLLGWALAAETGLLGLAAGGILLAYTRG